MSPRALDLIQQRATSGQVVIDTNCYKHLHRDNRAVRLQGSLKAADLFLWPSALNAIELAKNPNVRVRLGLLGLANQLRGNTPLLPLPDELLRQTGEAILSGQPGMVIGESGFEWLLEKPDEIDQAAITVFDTSLASLDELHERAFKADRPKIRAFLKAAGHQNAWASAQHFLDDQWMKESQIGSLIESDCQRLGLSGTLTFAQVMACETWRLHFEAFGAALFRRVISANQQGTVQATDLSQLIYLAGRRKRIIVSEDKSFLEAARSVLEGRYALARVMACKDFIQQFS